MLSQQSTQNPRPAEPGGIPVKLFQTGTSSLSGWWGQLLLRSALDAMPSLRPRLTSYSYSTRFGPQLKSNTDGRTWHVGVKHKGKPLKLTVFDSEEEAAVVLAKCAAYLDRERCSGLAWRMS